MNKRIVLFIASIALLLGSFSIIDQMGDSYAEVEENPTVTVNDASSFITAMSDVNTAWNGTYTIDIIDDIDMSNQNYTSPTLNTNNGSQFLRINGNGHTISGLSNMLISETWAGKTGVEINSLTISESRIVVNPDDNPNTTGVGAFIGFPEASETIRLIDCHLIDSWVEGGHWTGGLIGYAAGFAEDGNGPVFMTLTIRDCSVEGSTITGKGSCGGMIGHGMGSPWTMVVMDDISVQDTTVMSTGDSDNKAGAVIGTLGVGGEPTTADGETKTGGLEIQDMSVGAVDVTSNGVDRSDSILGRQGNTEGTLKIENKEVEFESENEGATMSDVGMIEVDGKYYSNETIVPDTPPAPSIPDDDDELPFIPPQSGDDGGADTTTYVAVAAAAAVVAILAVLAVGISKGKL